VILRQWKSELENRCPVDGGILGDNRRRSIKWRFKMLDATCVRDWAMPSQIMEQCNEQIQESSSKSRSQTRHLEDMSRSFRIWSVLIHKFEWRKKCWICRKHEQITLIRPWSISVRILCLQWKGTL
jgi:hypothetical protein